MTNLVIDDGTGQTGNSYASSDELDGYLLDRDYPSITSQESVLIRAFDFMSFTTYCNMDIGKLKKAQCEIARTLSNGFDLSAIADDRVKIEESLGRGALVDKWEKNSSLSGTDGLTMLKRIPMAYQILKPLICSQNTGLLSN